MWENQFQQKKDCDTVATYYVKVDDLNCERISSNKRRIATVLNKLLNTTSYSWENQFQQKKDCDLDLASAHGQGRKCERISSNKRRIATCYFSSICSFCYIWWENQFQQKKDCDCCCCCYFSSICSVRESVPTKEGLRLCPVYPVFLEHPVRESVPTKEGLRQFHL